MAEAKVQAPVAPDSITKLQTIIDGMAATKSADENVTLAGQFADAVNEAGVLAMASMVGPLRKSLLENKKNAAARQGGVVAIKQLVEKLGLACVGTMMDIVPLVLALTGDKKSGTVRKLAEEATLAIFALVPESAVPVYIRQVLIEGKSSGMAPLARWQTKVASLKLLSAAAEKAPRELEGMMTELVPVVSKAMWDLKKPVKEQAAETLEDICAAIDNDDLEPFVPALVEAIANPETVPDCVYALAGTTFVQTVKASALSITIPVLQRGFKDPKTAIKRKCAVITENMAKLVRNPADVAPFMPVLVPFLADGMDKISDPECRARFATAHETLQRVGAKGEETAATVVAAEDLRKELARSMKEAGVAAALLEGANVTFASDVAAALCNVSRAFLPQIWTAALSPLLLASFAGDEAAATAAATALAAYGAKAAGEDFSAEDKVDDEQDDDDAPDLCNLTFSLAYGTKILLNNSRLHLKKGYKYGIIASKSAGKTTMMRAISNGQVEGFPSPAQVRTVFLENDIQGNQMDMNVVEYVLDTVDTPYFKCPDVTTEVVEQSLLEGGFTDTMMKGPIIRLSGGWKMKLALIRATLQKADIMLMDEPTNHLDVINVQWCVDYINSIPDVTCLIVSHDTGFLDKTVSHIIHFEDDLRLRTYKGNISAFVERFPDAKSYFELGQTKLKFIFPQPTLLDGVKTRGTCIMEMKNVNFAYPSEIANAKKEGRKVKNQLNGVSVKCSMASRVACVGANGAGKSTMIKLLTGEMKPSEGVVKKHPNCRFAYVAQHAFHHIEQHLEKSPNEYIRWRYEGGVDKEARAKSTAQISEQEKKIMEKPIEVQFKDEETGAIKKEKRVVEKLVSRRKVKKEYHYELKWKGKSMDFNSWYSRDFLTKRGFLKLIKQLDMRLAAAMQVGKPLTSRNVEEHLGNCGLEAESATHSRIKDLSGGQKVKVVLAACTWMCPHLIILDEPTNYLDRDSLGALANAINDFEGGVILITHNKEFADATTKVTWVVANNRCDIKGDPEWEKYAAEQEIIQAQADEDAFDAAGNKISKKKIKTVEEMTKKEIRQNKKLIKQKIKGGEELEEHEMDWADEWNIKYVIPE